MTQNEVQPDRKSLREAIGCPHVGDLVEGDDTVLTRTCNGCPGTPRLKVFHCLHPAREPEQVTAADCQKCAYRPVKRAVSRKIILKNHMSPGDVLVMTAAVHSLHRHHPGLFATAVNTTCPAVWEHNPDVSEADDSYEVVQTHYPLVNESNQRAVHVLQGYCDFLEDNLKVRVPLLVNRPLLYLSNREKTWLPQVHEITGKARPYWLVNAGVKECFTAKAYPWYQGVVDALQGKVLFVQVGKREHIHRPLVGVIDLLGQTDDRQLIRLVHHSAGVLCGVTFLMHIAAALQKPAVVLAGGREPRMWNTYPLQTLFSTVGALDCCRTEACWRSRTLPLDDRPKEEQSLCEQPMYTEPAAPRCMAIIEPEEVARAILRYQP